MKNKDEQPKNDSDVISEAWKNWDIYRTLPEFDAETANAPQFIAGFRMATKLVNYRIPIYDKYSFRKENNSYVVVHKEEKNEIIICIAETSEKAHFIATACNSINQPTPQ